MKKLCLRKNYKNPSKKFLDILNLEEKTMEKKQDKILNINILQSQTTS